MRQYRPAVVTDAQRLLEMMKSSRMKIRELPSMTFVAEEDGSIQAALGVDWQDEAVVAGPFVVAPEAKGKRWMVLRLIETMERFLAERGVTSYLLSCACTNARWNRILQKAGCQRYATKNGRNWYTRKVGAYG